MSDATQQNQPVSTRPSGALMWLGIATGAVGFFLGFLELSDGTWQSAIVPVVTFSVGAGGLVAFVRHSVFYRSDAVRMGWDLGRRNDFQIEVGFANLAWGVVALLSWLLSWGAKAQGAVTLVFGIYMLLAAGLHVAEAIKGSGRGIGGLLMLGLFAGMLLLFGIGAVVA